MNALELINYGSNELRKAGISSSSLDSEIILSKILKKEREKILINLKQEIDQIKVSKFKKLVKRRSFKEPIAYIFKEKEFWNKLFEVSKDTLVPRPETELMVESLVKIYKGKKIRILDVGTGSGCILIGLLTELKQSNGIGIDISNKAISIAKKNANKHLPNKNVKFFVNKIEAINQGIFDVVVSNPPYIKSSLLVNLDKGIKSYEPKIALDGGNDGLDVIKKVIYKAIEILKISGMLALEIGNEQQFEVSKILTKKNFRIEHIIKDYKENTRCLISRLNR